MSLADVFRSIDEDKKRDLREYIESTLREENVKEPMGPDSVVRASGIHDFCPRMEAIRVEKKINVKDVIEPKLSRIFRTGRAYEKAYRDEIFGNLGVLIGKWECKKCGDIPDSFFGEPRYKKPSKCIHCGTSEYTYKEEFALDKDSGVGGSTDGFIYWNNDYALIDFKTANNRRFTEAKKKGPSENYIAQLQVYMRLHGYKKGIIWYVNKDNCDEAVFWIDYDSKYATLLMNKGIEMKEFFRSGTMPQRICVNTECQRAQDCPVREICFGEMKDR